MSTKGINLNFTGAGVNIPQQLAEIKQSGFTKVRLNIIRYNVSQAGLMAWRGYTQEALKQGFSHVIWGFGTGTGLTASNYNDYANGILEQARWFQAQNDPRLEFQIGNEEELHHDASISNATLRANLRQLSTEVKKIYTVGPISYSSSVFVGNEIQLWTNEGIGELDRIGFNLYGSEFGFRMNATAIKNNFGNRGFISEWGTDNGFQDFQNEDIFTRRIINRKRILTGLGVDSYYYNFMESGNRWGVKMYPVTGDFRTVWPHLIDQRPWFRGNPNVKTNRGNTPLRSATPNRPNTPLRGSI